MYCDKLIYYELLINDMMRMMMYHDDGALMVMGSNQ